MRERRIAGRYLLTRELGAGSSGTVYLADDLVLRKSVAVKVASRAGNEADEALRQEFDFLGRLRHPNLPEVYEFGRDPAIGVSFFSMEYVEGVPLDRALQVLGAAAAHELLAQALRALGFHHARGFVHGDLKPANVLVSSRPGRPPRLKLIDLGLSGLAGQGEPGVVRGTPRYSATTVLGGRPPTPSSDLYALGATFLDAIGPAAVDGGAGAKRVSVEVLGVLRRLVAEDEHARYQSAEHALRELEPLAAAYADEGTGVEPLFVGRAPVMARLEARLDELLEGRVSEPLTLLVGEAGIGKSRVADELARRAAQRLVTVCRGRAAQGTPSPWLPLRDVLRHLEILFDEENPALADRIGSLLVSLERAPDDEHAAAAGDEDRLADDLRRVLGAAARGRPLLLVLEDLQWVDPSTSAFLADVGWRGFDGPVWTLALVRAEAGDTPAAALPVVDAEATVRLGRLDAADTRALVASLFEQPLLTEPVLQRLVEVTEGHPGFAEAAARAVLEAGAGLAAEELDRTVYRRLPASRAEALELQLAALSPEELELARALAVLARPTTLRFLARFAALPSADLGARLEGLVRSAIVRREGHGSTALYALRSDTLRMRLRDGTDAAALLTWQRSAMHAWLDEDAGSGVHAEMIAEHALECGERETALLHGGRSVRRALARQAPAAALAWCRRLVQLEPSGEERQRLTEWQGDAHLGLAQAQDAERAFAEALACGAASAAVGARCRLLRKCAAARIEAGDHEGARHLLEEVLACDAAEVPAEDRAQVYALLGRVLFALGRVEDAERHVRTGLEALGGLDVAAAAALWNNLGVIAHERSDYQRSEVCHRRALAIREQHGDEEGRSRSLTNLGNLAMIAGRHLDARRLYEEALALKRRFGNRQTLARSLSNLALLDASLGHYGVAIQRHEEALRHRLSIADLSGVAFSHRHLAEVWHQKGELEKALDEARTAVRCARELGLLDRALCAALTIEAGIEATLGRAAHAEALLDEAIALAREIDCPSDEAMARLARARVQRWTAPARAAEELAASLPLIRAAAEPPRLLAVLLEQAELALDLDLDAAEAAATEAAETAQGLQDPLLSARTEHVRGEVALRRGRVAEASERLHRAMDWSSALSVPECEWRVAVSLASFHERQGRTERGILWLRRCVQVFRRVLARVSDPALAQSYVDAPERAAVLRLLEEWLE